MESDSRTHKRRELAIMINEFAAV
ncbi:MAG: hypothetical protein JWR37_785, partial [Mycobacterium sp.]|nr:hypothetical protein [Mycobacterium sp.]